MSLLDAHRQWFESRHELDATGTPRDLAATVRQELELVPMDCQMPEMGGYEATARIRTMDGA